MGGDKPSLTKVAAILGCSRPSLYTWIYQYGLEALAGIEGVDTLDNVLAVERKRTHYTQEIFSGHQSVKSSGSESPRFPLVPTQPTDALKVPATFKLDQALVKRMKKLAIDRDCSLSQLVEEMLLLGEAGKLKAEAGK